MLALAVAAHSHQSAVASAATWAYPSHALTCLNLRMLLPILQLARANATPCPFDRPLHLRRGAALSLSVCRETIRATHLRPRSSNPHVGSQDATSDLPTLLCTLPQSLVADATRRRHTALLLLAAPAPDAFVTDATKNHHCTRRRGPLPTTCSRSRYKTLGLSRPQ